MSNTAVQAEVANVSWWRHILSALGFGHIGQPLLTEKSTVVDKIYIPGVRSPAMYGMNLPPRWVIRFLTERGKLSVNVKFKIYDDTSVGDRVLVEYRVCRWTGRLKGDLY